MAIKKFVNLSYKKRPVSRTYAYNLDLSEHYYSHYLNSDHRGPLTFEERLALTKIRGHRHGDDERARQDLHHQDHHRYVAYVQHLQLKK